MSDSFSSTPASSGEGGATNERLNNFIALAVAIISAFLAIAKTKDDNIVQAIQKSQAELTDSWNQYQAKRLRQFTLDLGIAQSQAMIRDGTLKDTPENRTMVEAWSKESARYKTELAELTEQANGLKEAMARYNDADDLFDFSDAFLTLSLALMAVTALTRSRALFGGALAVGAVGVVFGIAGFLGYTAIKPAWLAALLGA